jgi:hypothetical protein
MDKTSEGKMEIGWGKALIGEAIHIREERDTNQRKDCHNITTQTMSNLVPLREKVVRRLERCEKVSLDTLTTQYGYSEDRNETYKRDISDMFTSLETMIKVDHTNMDVNSIEFYDDLKSSVGSALKDDGFMTGFKRMAEVVLYTILYCGYQRIELFTGLTTVHENASKKEDPTKEDSGKEDSGNEEAENEEAEMEDADDPQEEEGSTAEEKPKPKGKEVHIEKDDDSVSSEEEKAPSDEEEEENDKDKETCITVIAAHFIRKKKNCDMYIEWNGQYAY